MQEMIKTSTLKHENIKNDKYDVGFKLKFQKGVSGISMLQK